MTEVGYFRSLTMNLFNNMKKFAPILILLFVFSGKISAQQQIGETEKLAITCKIWGFLKYYHPNVINGNINWDSELLSRIPEIKKLKTTDDVSNFFSNWISELGNHKLGKRENKNSEDDLFLKNYNLDWIDNSTVFNTALKNKLLTILNAQRSGKQHYVKLNRIGNSGKAEPKNEKEYKEADYLSEENLRLLDLYRFWNFIEYFFPYKYQTDQNWDDVLFEMIPKFKNASTPSEYHLTMLELTVKLDDSHANFTTSILENYFGKKWLPVSLKIIEGKAIVNGFYNEDYARKDHWEIGDVITKIENVEISEIYQKSKNLVNGSNEKAKLRMAAFKLFRSNKDSVEVEVEKNGNSSKKTASLYLLSKMKERNINRDKWKLLDNKIGYINLGQVRVKEVKEVVQNLSKTNGIIIDIRNYPLGTKDAIVAELSKSENDCFKSIEPDLRNPGRFIWKQARKKAGRKNKEAYQGKIVLLVNEETISYAELTCMCLQTIDNVTVIGSQTAGADGNVTALNFIGGFSTNISGIGMFYPDGKETQRIGIVPDIFVAQTLSGIRTGRDEILEKAIEFLNQ